ncbi:hypothetical protein ILUMI_01005 [Ignelater luminosus]|uniref:Nuclease HARBI1 n=1 Tax=Ignelater luminosus TaxID=2038154 RepID=A0A8K0DL53_IGNLU|nr:hypothetical protein ILUMI_01005 [Ignelater luminosus]
MSLPSVSSANSDQSEPQQIIRRRRRRPRISRMRRSPFHTYNEEEFKNRFRLSKHFVRFILDLIRNRIKPLTARNKSISAMNQLLITLRFYACGTYQINIGDHFNVSKATVSRIVHKVSHNIAGL